MRMINKFKLFESKVDLKIGDDVIVKYKDSKYFKKTGRILKIIETGNNIGDCNIILDFSGNVVTFYKSNLEKITQIVEYPSGEIINISNVDCLYLAAIGILTYNFDKGFYYFLNKNKHEIEDYII